ncbi:MAG: CD1247 N-terminal domain-containing protein [Syntrophomonadaceae bacterium]
MKHISEKVSYLHGLSEGLNVADSGPQGKIITGILNVLDEMTDALSTMQNDFEEFKEYVESIDDDLNDLEESIGLGDDIDDSDYIQLECSQCGEKVYFETDILDDEDVIEVICPRCNEVVFVNDGSFDYEPAYIENDEEYSSEQKKPEDK